MFEINLIPDVKGEAVKAQRMRNIIALFCVLIVSAFVVVILVLGGIKTGQDLTIKSKEEQVEALSSKLNSFSSLNGLLSIQSQMNGLDDIAQNKKLLSRLFSFIWVFQPTDGNQILYSEVSVNLDSGMLGFTAQAKASDPSISNYVVLEAFEKSIPMMRYDFGRYVTKAGNEIPAVCVVESDEDGAVFMDGDKVIAKWAKTVPGCDPDVNIDEENGSQEANILSSDVLSAVNSLNYSTIYRTPKLNDWLSNGFLNEDGTISNVEHFESQCISYSRQDGKWIMENTCLLAPEGINISSKANGKNSDDELVLSFDATIGLDPQVFLAINKHLLAIGPSGRSNVTDSYVTMQELFTEEAAKCDGTNCDIN